MRTTYRTGVQAGLGRMGMLLAFSCGVPVHADDAELRERGVLGLRAAPLEGPLVTDRPDFTESTDAVPLGRVQIEMGYTFTYDREGDERRRDHSAPELLVRIGIAEGWELRIGWAGYAWAQERSGGETRVGRPIMEEAWSQGANDLSLGFKVKLAEQRGMIPHVGLIGEISVPTGSAGFGSGDVDPCLKLLWAYDLSERLSVAGNVNVGVPTENSHRFVQASGSVTVAVALNERWGTYVEYYGFYPNADGADCAHYLNGGLTYLVNDNFQFDWRIGAGLNREADDVFTGLGFSWRF